MPYAASKAIASLEPVYELVLEEAWTEVLELLYAQDASPESDPRAGHAAEVFLTEFFRALPPEVGEGTTGFLSESQAEAAERLVLFHVVHRLPLSRERFGDLLRRLITHYRDIPERALDFARFLPDDPFCAALLRQFEPPSRDTAVSVRGTGVHVTTLGARAGSAVGGLFGSLQERRFFEAISGRYPDLVAIPNVALHAFLRFNSIRVRLTRAERDFFFRALIDCVLFDPRDDHRALAAFELDSPMHDDDGQISRDAMKDRILAVAGLRLYRIRPDRVGVESSVFAEVLSEIDPVRDQPPRVAGTTVG